MIWTQGCSFKVINLIWSLCCNAALSPDWYKIVCAALSPHNQLINSNIYYKEEDGHQRQEKYIWKNWRTTTLQKDYLQCKAHTIITQGYKIPEIRECCTWNTCSCSRVTSWLWPCSLGRWMAFSTRPESTIGKHWYILLWKTYFLGLKH